MYHISRSTKPSADAKKIFGGTKSSRGGKKAISGRKNSVDLFFVFFIFIHLSFVGAPNKSAGGVKW